MTIIQGKPATQLDNLNILDTFFVKGEIASVDSQVIIRNATQLAGPVPLNSTKEYFIDGDIDMGSISIIFPQGGLMFKGLGFGVSQFKSSESNYTLFIDDGVFSGDLFINGLDIEVTGTGSKVFDLDNAENSNAVEFINTNFTNCTSLGNLKDYRQLLTNNVAFIDIKDGLTFDGTWSGGAAILTTIMLNIGAGVTIFKQGDSLSFEGSFRSDLNALSISSTTVLFDFVADDFVQDGAFSLTNVRVNPASNAVPNISPADQKSRFRNCSGIDNTFVGAAYTLTTAVSTGTLVDGTLVKMPGATTYSDEFWFSNSVDNASIYDSTLPGEVEVNFNLSFTGTANKELAVQVRQFDSSASAYVNIGPEYKATTNGGPAGTRAENVSGFAYATLNEDDRVEVWIKAVGSTNAITPSVGGSVIIKERAS